MKPIQSGKLLGCPAAMRETLARIDGGYIHVEGDVHPDVIAFLDGRSLYRFVRYKRRHGSWRGQTGCLRLTGAGRRLLYRAMDDVARLWLSDDGRYWARDYYPQSPMPDVIEIATGRVWLTTRWRLTNGDPRCNLPQFEHFVGSWSNHGHDTRAGKWIADFAVGFSDYDLTKIVDGRATCLVRHEARFKRRVPRNHKATLATARALVTAALAAERANRRARNIALALELHEWEAYEREMR